MIGTLREPAGSVFGDPASVAMMQTLTAQRFEDRQSNFHDLQPEMIELDGFETFDESQLALPNWPAMRNAAANTGTRRIIPWIDPILPPRAFIMSFSVLLFVLMSVAIFLWKISQSRHGLHSPTIPHYLWSYGPVAVLVLTRLLVKPLLLHRFQAFELWKRLESNGSMKNPIDILLLDYISTPKILRLGRALEKRHMIVVNTILVDVLLQIAIFSSTGLMITLSTLTPFRDAELELTMEFNEADYNSSYTGLLDNAVFAHANIRATVDVFQPDIRCQPAEITLLNATVDPDPTNVNLLNAFGTVSWDDCTTSSTYKFWISRNNNTEPPTRQLTSTLDSIRCPTSNNSLWVLIPLLDCRYNQPSIDSAIFRAGRQEESNTWSLQIESASSAVCAIDYTIKSAQVTYKLNNDDIVDVDMLSHERTPRRLEGFKTSDFYERLVLSSKSSQYMIENYLTSPDILLDPNPFYTMMTMTGRISIEDFLKNDTGLATEAATVLQHIGAQVATTHVCAEITRAISGSVQGFELRLQVVSLAAWVVIGALLVAALSATLLALSPDLGTSMPAHREDFMIQIALMTQRSQHLYEVLQNAGSMSLNRIEAVLSCSWSNDLASGSRVDGSSHRDSSRGESTSVSSEDGAVVVWWEPLLLRSVWFFLASFFPVILIIGLEILQIRSNRVNGIAQITKADNIATPLLIRLVPASIVMLAILVSGAVLLKLSIFVPFMNLKRSNARLLRANGTHPSILHQALHNHSWARSLIRISTFLGSLLLVFVSELYAVEPSPGVSPISVQHMDQFDLSWPDSIRDDRGSATILTDLVLLNSTLPSLTTEELAIPSLKFSPKDVRRIQESSVNQIAVTIPATRPTLICESVAIKGQMQANFRDAESPPSTILVNFTRFYSEIHSKRYGSYNQHLSWSISVDVATNGQHGFLGTMLDIHAPSGSDMLNAGERARPLQADNGPGMPSLAFIYAQYDWPSSHWGNISVTTSEQIIMCSQMMTTVQANVTLSIPDLRILSAVTNESSVTYLSSDGTPSSTILDIAILESLPYRLQPHFATQISVWDDPYPNTSGPSTSPWRMQDYPDVTTGPMDNFFKLLLRPPDGGARLQPDYFISGNTVEETQQGEHRFANDTQKLYRRYMAQVLNSKMRVPRPASQSETYYTGQWMNPDRAVIRQNKASKIILQVFLGLMVGCNVGTYLLVKTKNLLPHNPCSIAGMASLFAGSRMCEYDEAVEMMDPKEWMERKLKEWEGRRFNLGWWTDGEGAWRYGIDYADEEADQREEGYRGGEEAAYERVEGEEPDREAVNGVTLL
ncbi:hypothetical protein K461DRAFT_316519 [Myriangium duriaei CBS 260.36]|uniref:Uncharacterized protein n=1 Tax=Myriangium duriaei CBS 260.36 TaxID=1168546 RepID=A0A9P4IQB7_9PEZI|nr:hypothetical protein K461DRAFT_316519 [Myriangium duriaei CBS 260.36]